MISNSAQEDIILSNSLCVMCLQVLTLHVASAAPGADNDSKCIDHKSKRVFVFEGEETLASASHPECATMEVGQCFVDSVNSSKAFGETCIDVDLFCDASTPWKLGKQIGTSPSLAYRPSHQHTKQDDLVGSIPT